jgi:polar amino acid transport system substrate-binding protein
METPIDSSPPSQPVPGTEVTGGSPQQATPTPPASRRSMKPLLLLLTVIFLGGLLFSLWYFTTQTKKSTTSIPNNPQVTTAATKPIKLIIGTDPTLPPMESTENGTLVGYDIDFANFIAKEMGAEVEFKKIGFDDLFPAVEQKKIDMIISAVTITDERKLKYGFSDPYLNAGQVIIIKKTTTDITLPTTLSGKKVGVQQGTTNETEALKYTVEKNVVRFKDFEAATKALQSGTVDAIMTDLPNARGIVGENKDFKIAGDPFTFEYYGIVMAKDNTALKTQVNQALSSLQRKGILEDLKQKWFE